MLRPQGSGLGGWGIGVRCWIQGSALLVSGLACLGLGLGVGTHRHPVVGFRATRETCEDDVFAGARVPPRLVAAVEAEMTYPHRHPRWRESRSGAGVRPGQHDARVDLGGLTRDEREGMETSQSEIQSGEEVSYLELSLKQASCVSTPRAPTRPRGHVFGGFGRG